MALSGMAHGNWSTAQKVKVNGLYYIIFPDTKTAMVGTADPTLATDKAGGIYRGDNTYSMQSVTIPESFALNGVAYTVTEINKFAFYNGDIQFITVPETVTEVGASAFCYSKLKSAVLNCPDANLGGSIFECSNLKAVKLPDGLKKIPDYAFLGTPLSSINIPNSVTEIGKCAFYKCSNLETLIFPTKIKTLTQSLCAFCPALKTVRLPEGILEIVESAFQECKQLSNINFPSSLKRIDGWAFADCTSLKNVSLSPNVNIRKDAFDGTGYKPTHTIGRKTQQSSKKTPTKKTPTKKTHINI